MGTDKEWLGPWMWRPLQRVSRGVYWTFSSWSTDLLRLPDLLSHQIGQIPILVSMLPPSSLIPPPYSSSSSSSFPSLLQLPFFLASLPSPLSNPAPPQWCANMQREETWEGLRWWLGSHRSRNQDFRILFLEMLRACPLPPTHLGRGRLASTSHMRCGESCLPAGGVSLPPPTDCHHLAILH